MFADLYFNTDPVICCNVPDAQIWFPHLYYSGVTQNNTPFWHTFESLSVSQSFHRVCSSSGPKHRRPPRQTSGSNFPSIYWTRVFTITLTDWLTHTKPPETRIKPWERQNSSSFTLVMFPRLDGCGVWAVLLYILLGSVFTPGGGFRSLLGLPTVYTIETISGI